MENLAENREIAVKLTGVKKRYRLGQIGGGSLRADLQSWWARIRKKEDPNSKIGADQRLIGQTFFALNGIDLTVYKGEAVGIIGGNGAGKSTMLKLLSRVTAPTEGEIDINGRIASMLEVGTGFHQEMTGRENVYLNGAILGMTKAEIDAKMEQIIEFSEVREFIDTPVKRYSSGMFVKLAFAVAAHLDAEIMIMDEVLAVGDVNFQQKCLKKMREAAKEDGRTVLYVSHNMSTIRQLCDRCIVLSKGKVVFEGDVEEAILVYSNAQKIEAKNYYELSELPRSGACTDKFRMQTIKLKSGKILDEADLDVSLGVKCTEASDNILLRMVVKSNSGNVVGTAFSDTYSLKVGDNVLRFTFDTKSFAPGEYQCDIVLFEFTNDIQIRHDFVAGAFAFQIEETEMPYNMRWNRRYWGDSKLPKMKKPKKED
ncbi:MAG: ATP-binding cassette domain-containing protein [Clostridia bacterium]|nr:ATP-binding cassette domain-containing protein [Clostridia bacterium]